MRIAIAAILMIVASCSSRPATQTVSEERLTADTPKTTTEGNTFIAPSGWGLLVRGPATILAPPEDDSHIALVDVTANDAYAAVAAAWSAYDAKKKWPLRVANDSADKDGWSSIRYYYYQTDRKSTRLNSSHIPL